MARHNPFKSIQKLWKSIWHSEIGRAAVAITVAYFTGYFDWGLAFGGSSYVGIFGAAGIGNTLAAGFSGGFAGSGGDLEAGLRGAATAALFYGVGSLTDFHAPTPDDYLTPAHVANIAGHAAVGCASEAASGGSCGAGAFSAAAGSFVSPHATTLGFEGGLVATTVIGGTASAIGGGNFANGAVTAAFGYLFNAAASGIFRHHWVPREVREDLWSKGLLTEAAYDYLKGSTSGPLSDHKWSNESGHPQYNQAAKEIKDDLVRDPRQGISRSNPMNVDKVKELETRIKESPDQRIQKLLQDLRNSAIRDASRKTRGRGE